ncbi:MAG: bifunctional folylpolyglutamate synthase/dihydrofolate synthase [Bacteroidales bacterium]|nr:bifunctional folylpolyglutamate synthase/dihydrofolate synthase [Bacteroidales bacterium]
MTYDEAIAFWYGRINYEVRSATPFDLKLERMRALLRLLGDPQDRLRIVHVAGTKGKGSTCALLDSVLRQAGYRVGLFTSPHLVHVEERIRVNGMPISHQELAARMAEVATAVRELERGPFPPPTFFEIGTALGFLHFVQRRVDLALVEVGLGGRFDSTNVCQPLVSVITSIGWDHLAQLGSTREAIAYQKAGIIKRGVPVVSGALGFDVQPVIAQEAARFGNSVRQLGQDFHYRLLDGPRVEIRSAEKSDIFPLGLLGDHQAANAAVAVAVVEELRRVGLTIPRSALQRGLEQVRWPARVEVLARRPLIVLDSAHNVPSAEALVATLRTCLPVTGRKTVVFAVSLDKQFAEILKVLVDHFDHFELCRYGQNPRAASPEQLAELLIQLAPGKSFTVHSSALAAWRVARQRAKPDDLVCITGSVFLAGELCEIVAQDSSLPIVPLTTV